MPITMLSRYRIRGFPDIIPEESKPELIPAVPAGADPTAGLGRLVHALGRPRLSDILYHAKILPRLSALWPTFGYLRPQGMDSIVKEAPLHLYHYVDFLAKDTACRDIVRLGERQEAEEKAIAGVLWDGGEGPIRTDSPWAMALNCYVQRGTAWLSAQQNDILPIILQSSGASYIALCAGFFRGDVRALLDKLSEDPRLTLEVWRNPTLRRLVTEDWFTTALRPHPAHQAVWLFLQDRGEDALRLLHQSAGSHPVCAGLCLGLEPTSERADDWLAVVAGAAEPFYWMGRVWRAGQHEIASHPHFPTALTELRRDPRWYYHWLRDVAPEEAPRSIPELGLSPWAVELVVDLNFSRDSILDLYDYQTLDPTKNLDSALLRWASDHVLPN